MKKRLLFFFLVFIILLSCSPEEEKIENPISSPPPTGQNPGTPPAETFNINAETTTVLPYRIVVLSSSNQNFPNETYAAKFGENDITLVRNPEGNLVFAIPDLESGNYSFKLVIDGKESKIEFKVNSSQISDANAVVKTEVEEPLEILKQDIDALIGAGGIIASTKDQLNSAKLMYSNFIDNLSNSSDAEKMDIAQFYKANPIFSSHINTETRAAEKSSHNGFSCFEENADMLATATAILKDWEVIAIVLEGTDAEEIEGPGAVAFVGGYLAASTVFASQERLLTSCSRPVSSSLVDTEGNTENFELTNDEFKSFLFKTGVRTLTTSDIGETNEKVSKTVENINQISGNWERTITSLNTVITNSSSWFNDWLTGNNSFKAFSYLQSLPDSATESLVEGNNEFVSITGLPSDVTAAVEKNDAGKMNIKFNAPETALPRDITGKIVYNDGLFRVENNFNIILSAAGRNYKLELGYYNSDQSITTEKVLSQGDELIMPNNMSKYVRMTLEGEPIDPTGGGGGWVLWYFGDSNQNPTNTEDIFIENYEFTMADQLNGGIYAYFKIDLTLSNQSLRYLVENTYQVSEFSNGVLRQGPFKIKHNLHGSYTRVDPDGSTYTGSYRIVLGDFSRELQCHNYVFDKETIGVYTIDGYQLQSSPGSIELIEGGDIIGIESPYGCREPGNGWLFEKMD